MLFKIGIAAVIMIATNATASTLMFAREHSRVPLLEGSRCLPRGHEKRRTLRLDGQTLMGSWQRPDSPVTLKSALSPRENSHAGPASGPQNGQRASSAESGMGWNAMETA